MNDVASDPRFYGGVDQKTGAQTRAILTVPLASRQGRIGVLQALNPHSGGFTADDLAFLDEHGLVVWAAGPVDLPSVGPGELAVRYTDFRRVGSFTLPFHASYRFRGAPLADEQAVAVCPEDHRLTPEGFADPAALPTCAAEPTPRSD